MALTMDPITVKTDLAENYMKKYNNFEAWPAPDKYWLVKKYPEDIVEHGFDFMYQATQTDPIGSYAARKIVKKIKEYESTFYQLEYLIRKTDKADFQNYMLLMYQHLQCTESWDLGYFSQISILMSEKTPLYVLGCAAAAKSREMRLAIVTTQKMAPICHLFTEICTEFGWTINLVFINDINDHNDTFTEYSCDVPGVDTDFGCTGVVTESADIDSALDVFINSSITAPWRLHNIYVQESVYEEVRDALAARSGRTVVESCGDAYVAGGKQFLCEALGAAAAGAGRVPLEPYRTARELAALLRTAPPARALSLWAADAQLAHEVALAAPATLVWLNEYAAFHGPPASSLPVYEPLYSTFVHGLEKPVLQRLKILWTAWNELSRNERIDSVMNALRTLSSAPEGYDSVADFQNAVLNARDESSVSVDGGEICMCVERRPLFEDIVLHDVFEYTLASSVKALIYGRAVVYDDMNWSVLRKLEEVGAPVVHQPETLAETVGINIIISKKLKVIRSNFGTIFAN